MTTTNKLTKIADRYLAIETFKVRGRDDLDFHTLSAASIERAMRAAYELGHNDCMDMHARMARAKYEAGK